MTTIFKLAAMAGGSTVLFSRYRVEWWPGIFAWPINTRIGSVFRSRLQQQSPAISTDSSD